MNSNVNNCINNFCKKRLENELLTRDRMINSLKKDSKKSKDLKNLLKTMNTKKSKDELIKRSKETCPLTFCNKECKNTIFEDGNKLSKKLQKSKDANMLSSMKKDIMNGKKTILKNSFFEGIQNSKVNSLKKNGAISACSIGVFW